MAPCELCPHEDSHEPTTVSWGAQSLAVGDEVHAVTSEGTWLVAPTLVLHYVTAHDYLPPPVEFALNAWRRNEKENRESLANLREAGFDPTESLREFGISPH